MLLSKPLNLNLRGIVFIIPLFLISLIHLLFFTNYTYEQTMHLLNAEDSIYYASKTDSLKKSFPFCSNIPDEYALAFYTAASHYPELQQTRIEFKIKPLKTTMATRPSKFLFISRSKRVYKVYINNRADFNGIYLSSLNYDQQVGIIGHELAHILDYSHKSAFRLIASGIGYLVPSYRKKFEGATDIRTIKHGLGWQLFDFVDYLMNRSHASDSYLRMKKRIYLNEGEIRAIILAQ